MAQDPVALVAKLHTVVGMMMEPQQARHEARLRCGVGCAACCRDDLSVFEVEAELIKRHHPSLLETQTPHPKGACAFLNEEGACRVYDVRPYVCRSHGLPIRWHEVHEGEVVEYRDICPLNDVEGEPLESLEEQDLWLIGPVEDKLATFQAAFGTEGARVSLRALFASEQE